MFLLHGNVYDVVLHDGRTRSLSEFLAEVLLKDSKDTIALYNVATGVRFSKRAKGVELKEELLLPGAKEKTLAALETLLTGEARTAVVLEYTEALAPAGDPAFQADSDRASIVTLHRWSFLPSIEKSDNVVLLVVENLTEIAPKLVSNPKIAVVEIPMPDRDTRRQAALLADPRLPASEADRYAEITAGLKALQIAAILAPPPPSEEERAEREAYIAGLLGGGADAKERAQKLAGLTAGLDHAEIGRLLAPGVSPAQDPALSAAERAREEAYRLIAHRKREILERECFGLVEFVAPEHGFEVVGGMDEVKKELAIALDLLCHFRK